MARISLHPPRTLAYRVATRASSVMFGGELAPGRALGHNAPVMLTIGVFEGLLGRWRALDRRLRELGVMAAAHTVGCSWCIDFGYWTAAMHGIDEDTVRAVPTWRDSDRFTPVERRVMEYAEAMSMTPVEVTDEMVSGLEQAIGTKALVELTMMVAVENQRSRFNSAMGLTSEGFKERCEVPAAGARRHAAA